MGESFTDALALLDVSAEQIEDVRKRHAAALRSRELDVGTRALIKNTLENQRSALDYVAHELVDRFGVASRYVYYPIASKRDDFPMQSRRKLPGVEDTRPDAVEYIAARQPFVAGYGWLQQLSDFVNPVKHIRLVPLLKTEERRHEISGPNGSISWLGGAVTIAQGVMVNGISVPQTSPLEHVVPNRTTVYVGWAFEGSQQDILSVLRTIQKGSRDLITGLAALVDSK